VQMTVIATGFPPKAQTMDTPEEVRKFAEMGLPGVSSMDDAELPAFLRRNIRSLNSVGGAANGLTARLAERR